MSRLGVVHGSMLLWFNLGIRLLLEDGWALWGFVRISWPGPPCLAFLLGRLDGCQHAGKGELVAGSLALGAGQPYLFGFSSVMVLTRLFLPFVVPRSVLVRAPGA